jgi:uncharacterized protein
MVIIDTGPLVALFDSSEPAHETCKVTLQAIGDDLVTSWSVLTEAFYILEDWKTGQANLWNFIMAGAVQLYEIQPLHYGRLEELMRKYSDRPMDLADATIVLIAESLKIRTIFTLDKKDFSIYRPKHCRHFEIIPE